MILGQEGQRDGERGRRIILFFSPLYYMVKAVKLCVKSAEVSCHNTTQQLCFYLSLTSLLDCGWLQILDSGVYSAQTYFSADLATVGRNVCVCFPVLTRKYHGYLDVVFGHWNCGNTMVFSENTLEYYHIII